MTWSPQQDAAIKADGPYYVYEHIRLDTGLPFYVGKGKGGRMNWPHGRNRHWKSIVAKHGFEARVVASGLDEELALFAEVERIDQYARVGIKLCNMTIGGEGASLVGEARERYLASVRSKEYRAKKSASSKQTWTNEQTRAKRKAGLVMAFSSADARDRLRASSSRNNARPEVRTKLSDAGRAYWNSPGVKESRLDSLLAASKAVCARQVRCVQLGLVFASFADAAKWLREFGKPKASHSAIVNACKGKLKSAYGFNWAYADGTSVEEVHV